MFGNRWLGGLAILACVGTLGGCGAGSSSGGSSSTSGGGGTIAPPVLPSWATDSYTSNFNSSAASTIRNSSEYQNVDANSIVTASPNAVSPYNLIHLDVAQGAGLTGAGETIAALDNGYLLTHQEFSGKTIHQYVTSGQGTMPVSDHGTHVASLIAGVQDGKGITGVAPDAALHLSSWQGMSMADMAAATNDAASYNAVAQNNSWGWTSSATAKDVTDRMSSLNQTAAQVLSGYLGDTVSGWNSYIGSLQNFEKTGVVVFAASNDTTATHADISSGMPLIVPSLGNAWITAIDGYFTADGSGNINSAHLLSAPCLEMATLCIAGDGATNGASSSANDAYSAGYGTSYVAPQVSGSVALIAEAFPDLTPSEWADRLLFSADNSWFPTVGVTADGTATLDGVNHSYSNEWGMGTLDLQAALSPIGSLTVKSGTSVFTGPGTSISGSAIQAPTSYGDGLKAALSGQKMAVFDALNANFTIDAGTLVSDRKVSMLGRMTKTLAVSGQSGLNGMLAIADPQATGFSTEHANGWTTRFGLTGDVGQFVGAPVDLASNASSVLSLTDTAAVGEMQHNYGALGLSMFGFSGSHADLAQGTMAGVGAALSLDTGSGRLDLGFSQSAEGGAVLGLQGNSAFDFGTSSAISAVDVGFSGNITSQLSVFGGAEYGVAMAGGAPEGGLVSAAGPLGFSGFSIGARASDIFTPGDKVTVSLSQPLRVESGRTSLSLPVGRTKDGTIVYDNVTADISPTGRELDLGLGYDLTSDSSGHLRLSATYAHDAGHVAGEQAFGVAAAYRQSF
jgi:subtilase-type serine protease